MRKYYLSQTLIVLSCLFLIGAKPVNQRCPVGANTSGLVGLWHCDEALWNGTAGEVKDATGVNNGVRVGNATTNATAKFGMSGIYDGTGDYVNCGNDDSLTNLTEATIMAWIRIDAKGSYQVIWESRDKVVNVQTYNISFLKGDPWTDLDRLKIITGMTSWSWYSNAVAGATEIEANIWYHVAAVVSSANLTVNLYVNGVNDGSGALDEAINIKTGGNRTCIGGSYMDNGAWFDGYIDDVAIFNRCLTSTEIKEYYYRNPKILGKLNLINGLSFVSLQVWRIIAL